MTDGFPPGPSGTIKKKAMITEEQARQDIRELLEYIGEDPSRTGLKDTPDRMLRMFKEIFRGYYPAQKPEITFDLDMPTVSSDEKQMIRSIINSEDEMNQQVLYLLGIGRFYPHGANNSAAQSEQQSQTSLAMHSLLSGTISTQINNVLSSVIQSNNWNFGANISTGDEGWNNAEYEGLLSGRLLNNRLLINGQFGYRDNAATTNTSSFIGDFDIRYLLKPNGNLSVRVYNQTNDRYFTKSSLNTQGVGLIMKKDFDGIRDLLNIKRKKKRGGK